MQKVIMIFVVVFAITYLGLHYVNSQTKPPVVVPPSPPTIVENTQPVVNEPELPAKPSTYAEALAIAKKFDKKVLLMFSSVSCGPCQHMKNTTLKNGDIQKILEEKYVFFLMEDDNENIFRKYMIFATPAYRIITADEKMVRKSIGYMDVNKFKNFLID